MEGTNGPIRSSTKIETVFHIKDDKIVRRNDHAGTKDIERLMGIVASKVHYTRSDMLVMYLHEFYALVNSLSEK